MVVVCGMSRVVCAQVTAELVAAPQIMALKHVWDRALETRDLKAMDEILDDLFVSVSDDGKLVTKAEFFKDLKESGMEQVITESMVVHIHGETAIATGFYRTKEETRGKLVTRRGRFVDTWLFKEGRWVGIASVSTPIG